MSKSALEQIVQKRILKEKEATLNRANNLLIMNDNNERIEDETKIKNPWEAFGAVQGTGVDLTHEITGGIFKGVEGIVDSVASLIGNVGDEKFKENISSFISRDWSSKVTEWVNKPTDWLYNNMFNGGEDIRKKSLINKLDTKGQEFTRGVATSLGQMIPSMAMGNGVGKGISQVVSLGTFGLGAMGISTEEAINEGHSLEEATKYGALQGAKEVATEAIVGKALSGIGLGTGKIFGVIGKGAKEGTNATIKTVAKDMIKSSFEEGMEEVAGDFLDPLIEKVTIEKDKDLEEAYMNNEFREQLLLDFLAGALTSTILGGTQQASKISQHGLIGENAVNNFSKAQNTVEILKKEIKNGIITDERYQELQNKIDNSYEKYLENIKESEEKYGKDSKKVKAIELYQEEFRRTKEIANQLRKQTNIESLSQLGEDLGTNIRLTSGKDSYVDKNGDIVFGMEISNSFMQTLKDMVHEATHYLGTDENIDLVKQSGKYESIRNEVESLYTQDNINRLNEQNGTNVELSEEMINDEIVAKYMEGLFNNTSELSKVISNNKGIISRLRSFVNDKVEKSKADVKERQIAYEMKKKLREAINKVNEVRSREEKYSKKVRGYKANTDSTAEKYGYSVYREIEKAVRKSIPDGHTIINDLTVPIDNSIYIVDAGINENNKVEFGIYEVEKYDETYNIEETLEEIKNVIEKYGSYRNRYERSKNYKQEIAGKRMLPSNDSKSIYSEVSKNDDATTGGTTRNSGRRTRGHNGIEQRGLRGRELENNKKERYSKKIEVNGYERTNEFKRIQETSRGLSSEDVQLYHNGSKRIIKSEYFRVLERTFRRQIDSTRDSLRDEYQSVVNPNTSKEFKIHKNVNAELFHDIFEVVQNYLPNGDCVDVHDIKSNEWSTGYEDCNCYLAEDGLSGFAITPSGDLISVFSLSKEGGFLKSIKDFVKSEGAKTLDCYQSNGQPLATIYEKTLGFKTASILDFNYDILLDDRGKEYADYFVKTYGESPVHFMVNTNEEIKIKQFNKDQYDSAEEYQQSFLNERYSIKEAYNINNESDNKEKNYYSTVAPFHQETADLENRSVLRQRVQDVFFNKANDIADAIGIKIEDYHDNFGGYVLEEGKNKGNLLNEISYSFNLKAKNIEDAQMFSFLLGDLGYEYQEAVITQEYTTLDDINANGVEYVFKVKSIDKTIKAIQMVKPESFTLDENSKELKLSLFFDKGEVDWQDSLQKQNARIDSEVSKLKKILGDDFNENGEGNPIKSKYNTSGDRLNTYEAWLQNNDGAQNGVLYDYIREAYSRCKETRQKLEKETKYSIKEETKESAFPTKTVLNHVDSATREMIKALDSTYNVSKNKEMMEKALYELKDVKSTQSIKENIDLMIEKIDSGARIKPIDIMKSIELIKRADEHKTAKVKCAELVQSLGAIATEYGQMIQAISVINRMQPKSRMKIFDKMVKRLNNKNKDRKLNRKMVSDRRNSHMMKDIELAKRTIKEPSELREKMRDISSHYNNDYFLVPEHLKERLNSAKTDIEIVKANEEIFKTINEQYDATLWEKLESFRMLSMLANVKTHIRNVIGNVCMNYIAGVSNKMSALLQRSIIKDKMSRTRTIERADKQIVDYARNEIFTDKLLIGEAKYSFLNNKTIFRGNFGGKVLEKLRKTNFSLLEKEDLWSCKGIFAKSFANYCKAQEIALEQIRSDVELREKATLFAIDEAQKNTFKEYSKLAQKLNEITEGNKVLRFVSSAVMPFKKTPINIAKQGIRYSPIGLLKSVTKNAYEYKQGAITQAELIDNISQGLTGSGIFVIGIMLARIGMLAIGGSDDDKTKDDYDILRGKQNFALQIGDLSITLDWLSPSAIPLFMGVAFAESLKADDNVLDAIGTSSLSLLDPLTEMSVLSSLNSVLSTYEENKVLGIAETTIKNYGSSFIPTISKQIANVIDPTRRTTQSTGETGLGKKIESYLRSNISKISFLSMTLEPYIDVWGNEIKNYNGFGTFVGNVFEQTLSPAWWSVNGAITEVDKELIRLYKKSGNKDIIPYTPNYYYTQNGEKIYLSSKEYTAYKINFGKTCYNAINTIMKCNWYSVLTDEQKEELISKSYNYSRDFARKQGNLYELAIKTTMSREELIAHYLYLQNVVIETDEKTKKELVFEYINKMSLSKNNKITLFELLGYKYIAK